MKTYQTKKIKYTNNEFQSWLKQRNTKVSKRALKALDKDIITVIEVDGDYGFYPTTGKMPDYLYNQARVFVRYMINIKRKKEAKDEGN